MLTNEERNRQLYATITQTYLPRSVHEVSSRRHSIRYNNNLKPKLPHIPKTEKECNSNLECAICEENDINVFLYPCGHARACSACLLHLQKCATKDFKCPFCRERIEKVYRLYL